jgi:hypothetical protein
MKDIALTISQEIPALFLSIFGFSIRDVPIDITKNINTCLQRGNIFMLLYPFPDDTLFGGFQR